MRARVLGLLAASVAGLTVASFAHVRLQNPSNRSPLFWENPQSISIVVGAAGSDDVTDGSHTTALRNAIDVWNEVEGTSMELVEDASSEARSRTDWEADELHLIWFDEDNSSGFFPEGSGTVAVTPVWFFSSGKISDADVIFNGSGFEFTTSKEAGRFDVQDVATHEIGHLIGFDHSGWAGATMYPYVDPTILLHRSLSLDEVHGLRATYPGGAATASLTGAVLRSADSSRVAGAHVVARDANGRTAGGTLSAENGTFTLAGLPAGTYSVYATPLDEPVSSLNLTAGHSVEVDFETGLLPGDFTVAEGQSLSVGEVLVGDDVTLNLGRNVDRYPRRVIAGLTNLILIRGSGLTFGSTLSASSSDVTVFPVDWVGFQVSFQAVVDANAEPGHVDLIVRNPQGDVAVLPAGLEITPASPNVTSLEPELASIAGGSTITVRGTGFRPGLRTIIGSEIYREGAPGGCTLISETELTVEVRSAAVGEYDVVVIDATGVEGRLDDALSMERVPVVSDVFPAGGEVSGGTLLAISGAQFDEDASVTIGGVLQPGVRFLSDSLLEVTTEPAEAGGPFALAVTNSNSLAATLPGAFTYSGLPDPALTAIEPLEGLEVGGDVLTLRGQNLRADLEVLFGVNPERGTEGVAAESVTFVDEATLLVVTPAFTPGRTSVAVRAAGTGQAGVLPESFTFTPQPAASESGGGGGCVMSAGPGVGSGWGPGLGDGAWMLAACVWLLSRRSRLSRAATAPTLPNAR